MQLWQKVTSMASFVAFARLNLHINYLKDSFNRFTRYIHQNIDSASQFQGRHPSQKQLSQLETSSGKKNVLIWFARLLWTNSWASHIRAFFHIFIIEPFFLNLSNGFLMLLQCKGCLYMHPTFVRTACWRAFSRLFLI